MGLIGDNIKRLRKERKITKSELAKKLGVCKTTVSSWEIGRTEPNLEKTEEICAVLHCKKSEIYEKPEIYEKKVQWGKRDQMEFFININLDSAIDELSDISGLIDEIIERLKAIRKKYEGSET